MPRQVRHRAGRRGTPLCRPWGWESLTFQGLPLRSRSKTTIRLPLDSLVWTNTELLALAVAVSSARVRRLGGHERSHDRREREQAGWWRASSILPSVGG